MKFVPWICGPATDGSHGPLQQLVPSTIETVSIHHPTEPLELPVSVAQRHFNWTFCPAAEAGRSTSVVIKPEESPLQHGRLGNGLSSVLLGAIVRLYPLMTKLP